MPTLPAEDDVGPAYTSAKRSQRTENALERLQRLQASVAPAPTVLAPSAVTADLKPAAASLAPAPSGETAGEIAPATPASGGFSLGAVAKDVTQGLAETFTINPKHNAILTGVGNAVDELGDSLADLVLYPVGKSHEDLDRLFGTIETEGPQSTTGKLISGVTQFATGMYLGGKALTAVKAGTIGGTAGQAVARGAIGDVIAFDEHDQRLSNLVEQFPALRNPVTGYLAADPNDSFIEAKTKQALEGTLGGALAETLLRSLKAYRTARATQAATPAGQADAAINTAAREAEVAAATPGAGLEAKAGETLSDRDWMLLGGDPKKPLVEVTDTTVRRAEELVNAPGDRAAVGAAISEGMPDRLPGEIQVGNKVANINLNRINGPDDLLQVARDVGKMMTDAGKIGPTITQGTKEARRLADALLEDPATVETWLSGQTATGRAFSREEIIGAGEVLTKNLDNVRGLAKKIAAGGATDAEKLALHRGMALQQSMMKLVSQQGREAGRALQAFRTTVGGNKASADAIRNILANEANTEKMAAMIATLDQPGQANRFIKGVVEGGGLWSRASDALLEVFFNGILSGPRTHMVNIIGNGMNAMTAVVEREVGSWLPGATIPRGEGSEMLFGTLQGFKDGLGVAAQVWRSGVPADAAAKVEILKRRAITAERFGIDQLKGPGIYLAKGVDLLGEAIRLPGRALMTADEFFKTVAKRQQVAALAFRQAAGEGLDGAALAARVQELIANPPPGVVDDAASFAAYQTFTNPLGQTGKMTQLMASQSKWLRLIVPFIQTPTNILKYATERSPFGLAMKSVRDDLAAGGTRRDLAMAKIGLGSMVMATAADYAAQGLVTGAPPGDPGMRQAWERAGRLPYAVKIPGTDRWVQYNRLDPLGMTFGIAADLTNIMSAWSDAEGLELGGPKLGEVQANLREIWGMSEEEVQQAVDKLNVEQQQAGRITPERVMGAVVVAFKENLLNKSYLSGIAELSGAFSASSPQQAQAGVTRWIQRTMLGFVPFSAAIRTAEQVMDPTVRDAATLLEALRSMTPGQSASLPPLVDLWGQPRQSTVGLSPVATREETASPIDQEMIRLRMSVQMPAKDIKGVALEPEEYVRFAQLAGNAFKDPVSGLGAKDTLDAVVTGAHPNEAWNEMYRQGSEGPDGGKALLIRTIIDQFRQAAQAQVMQEIRPLAGAVGERERLKAERLQPPQL